jgi:hypothetical protein
MAFQGKTHIKCKMIDNKTAELVSSLNYLGFNVSNYLKEYVNVKLSKFQRMCEIIHEEC